MAANLPYKLANVIHMPHQRVEAASKDQLHHFTASSSSTRQLTSHRTPSAPQLTLRPACCRSSFVEASPCTRRTIRIQEQVSTILDQRGSNFLQKLADVDLCSSTLAFWNFRLSLECSLTSADLASYQYSYFSAILV